MATTGGDGRREQMQRIIGTLLRAGVILAAVVVLAGAVVYLLHMGGAQPNYRAFHGEPSDLRTVGGIIHDALHGEGRGLIQLGLLLLIATPIARVAFSLVAFAVERDRVYVVVTLIVLAVLIYSIIGRADGAATAPP